MTGRLLAGLIDTHAAALVLYARQWCAAPEDVVQAAFAKLAALGTLPDDPAAWLYRVVRNAAIDAGKADRRRQRREQAVARPVRWFAEPQIDGLDAAAAVTALEALPADQREVIVARLWGGMTLQQVADVTGCSVSSAHRRYESGIAALRERLGVPCPKKT
jgi:RNA polymerase sigma-70 factor (ECF subfamily)